VIDTEGADMKTNRLKRSGGGIRLWNFRKSSDGVDECRRKGRL
jgi:hypothetical protein